MRYRPRRRIGECSALVLCAVSATVLAAGVTNPTPSAAATTSGAAADDGTGSSRFAQLVAVSALSPTTVWAVGSRDVAGRRTTYVQRGNQTGWTVVTSPNPPGATASELTGVAAIGVSNVWAVGRYETESAGARTLILHWNGRRWAQVPSPSPGGDARDSALAAVSAVSADDVWAVGSYDPPGAVSQHALMLHWNGSEWSQVASPSPPGVNRPLAGIDMAGPTRGWAVGTTARTTGRVSSYAQSWNGHSWSQAATVSPGSYRNYLNAVSVVGPGNAWAVGQYQNEPRDTYALVQHYVAHGWHRVTVPNVANQVRLLGVDGDTPQDVWVVGFTVLGAPRALILHWNGHGWTRYSGPNPTGVQLAGITNRGSSATWTVGYRSSGTDTLAVHEHWTGRVWSR